MRAHKDSMAIKYKRIKMEIIMKKDFNNKIAILMGAAVLSGVVGFVYETIFYLFNNGVLTKRGGMFGPWITIYVFGGILLFLTSYRAYKNKHPLLVFVICGLAAASLEFAAGYYLYNYCGGVRMWDYSTEIINFGNIGGYVCFRSFWSFGLLGLFLMYVIYPFLLKLRTRMGDKKFNRLALIMFLVLMLDLVYNAYLCKAFGTISAPELYHNTGWFGIVSEYKG